jgi:hypothetical protein
MRKIRASLAQVKIIICPRGATKASLEQKEPRHRPASAQVRRGMHVGLLLEAATGGAAS